MPQTAANSSAVQKCPFVPTRTPALSCCRVLQKDFAGETELLLSSILIIHTITILSPIAQYGIALEDKDTDHCQRASLQTSLSSASKTCFSFFPEQEWKVSSWDKTEQSGVLGKCKELVLVRLPCFGEGVPGLRPCTGTASVRHRGHQHCSASPGHHSPLTAWELPQVLPAMCLFNHLFSLPVQGTSYRALMTTKCNELSSVENAIFLSSPGTILQTGPCDHTYLPSKLNIIN